MTVGEHFGMICATNQGGWFKSKSPIFCGSCSHEKGYHEEVSGCIAYECECPKFSKPVASPVTLSGEKCTHCGAEIEIQEGRWWGWVHGSDCPENHPAGHKPVAVTLSEGQDTPTLFQEVEAHRKELIVENLKLKETLADILAWTKRAHRKENNRANEAYNRALSVVEMYIEEKAKSTSVFQLSIASDTSPAVQIAMLRFNKKMREGQDTQEKK